MEGNWYAMFETYETDGSVRKTGTPHGPFDSQKEAEDHLEAFKNGFVGGDEHSPLTNAQLLSVVDDSRYRFWTTQLDEDGQEVTA